MHKEKARQIREDAIQDSLHYLLKNFNKHPVGFKGYYLKHLYHTDNEQACDALPPSWRIADYYYNKYLFNSNNKSQAGQYLKRYINIAKNEDYKLTHLYENKVISQTEELYTREFC